MCFAASAEVNCFSFSIKKKNKILSFHFPPPFMACDMRERESEHNKGIEAKIERGISFFSFLLPSFPLSERLKADVCWLKKKFYGIRFSLKTKKKTYDLFIKCKSLSSTQRSVLCKQMLLKLIKFSSFFSSFFSLLLCFSPLHPVHVNDTNEC